MKRTRQVLLTSQEPRLSGWKDIIWVSPDSRWQGESAYVFALHKSGSTLLNGMVQMLCEANDAAYLPLPNMLRRAGYDPNKDVRIHMSAYKPKGVIYGGFRNLPDYALPELETTPKILLVRHPLDILTSLYFSLASSHVEPGDGALKEEFARNRAHVQSAPVNRIAKERAPILKIQIERYLEHLPRNRLAVYFYEDVVTRKAAWLDDLCDLLGFEADAALKARILQRFDIFPDDEAPDAHIRRVLPGDHRNKLGPGTIDKLDALFAGLYDPLLPYRRCAGAAPEA